MSLQTVNLPHRLTTLPVTTSPHEQHYKHSGSALGFTPQDHYSQHDTPSSHKQHHEHSRSAPGLTPQDHHSQDDAPSSHKQHLKHASSAQDLKPQVHQLSHIPFVEPNLPSQSSREKKIKKFEELARNFEEQETIDDIVNWNIYLWEQLKDEKLVAEYDAWSVEYFRPETHFVGKNPDDVLADFRDGLRHADWNVGNAFSDKVSEMMLYDYELGNDGLFVLGTFQRFWLILRLESRAIWPQKTDPQLRKSYGVAEGLPGKFLGLRYKPIGDKSAASVLFFLPLGHILVTEAFNTGLTTDDDDFEKFVEEFEWTDTPFVLALGIRDDGTTECRKDGVEQFYFIHNPTYKSDFSHTPTEDSDDDAQDIIFCRDPPPYTVARVEKLPSKFFAHRISALRYVEDIGLEPLSISTPEIVQTDKTKGKDGRYTRFGLFPNEQSKDKPL